tara:strand:- start:532 stop:669 length:138 start_codon:yes stop_codon:yes gene_type:complete
MTIKENILPLWVLRFINLKLRNNLDYIEEIKEYILPIWVFIQNPF